MLFIVHCVDFLLVWYAGMKTEFGKTFEDMKDVQCRRTPLQMKMDELGKQLSVLSFGIIGIIALVGVCQVRVPFCLHQ